MEARRLTLSVVARTLDRMSHHWTPMSMVSRSIRPHEWRMADKREHLGRIRLVDYQGAPTYVCVTTDGWVVGGGDTLPDAARAFISWRTARADV